MSSSSPPFIIIIIEFTLSSLEKVENWVNSRANRANSLFL